MKRKWPHLINSLKKNQSGMATLICTLMLIFGASSIVIYCVKTQIFFMKLTSNEIKQRIGFMNAESGIEAFFYQLKDTSSRNKLFLKYPSIKKGNCKTAKLNTLSTEKYSIYLNSKSIADQNVEVEIISKGKNSSGQFISVHKRKIQIPTVTFRKPNAALITKGNLKSNHNAIYKIRGNAQNTYSIRAGGTIDELRSTNDLKVKVAQTKSINKKVSKTNIQNASSLDPDSLNFIGSKTLFKLMFGISKTTTLIADPFKNIRSQVSPERIIDTRLKGGSIGYCEKRLNKLKLSGGIIWIRGDCLISDRYLIKNPITKKNEFLIGSILSPLKLVIEGGTIKTIPSIKFHLFGILYLAPLNGTNDHTSSDTALKIDSLQINGNLLIDYEYVESGENIHIVYDDRVIKSFLELSNYGYEIINGSWSDF